MINKKYLALVAVAVASVSSMYVIYENTPTVFVVHGMPQYQDLTFSEYVEKSDLTVMGEITSLGVRVMPEKIEYYTDDNGVQQIDSRQSIPKQEITIKVLDVLNDKTSLSSGSVVIYDSVDKALGKKDGQTAEFSSMDAIAYHIGDVGVWHLQYEDNIFKTNGFSQFYPISKGSTTMTTSLDAVTNDAPINVEISKKVAKLLSGQSQD